MFSEKKPEPAWKRRIPVVLLGLLALGALAVLLLPGIRPEAGGPAGGVGFDVSGMAAPPPQGRIGSGLELVRRNEEMAAPPSAPPPFSTPKPKLLGAATANLITFCRQGEGRIREMAERYTKENPIIAEYGRAWMSYPDLRKLNDDYMRDRDPAKFLKGLAASKNFAELMLKYAGQTPLVAFVSEAISKSSPQEQSAALGFMSEEEDVGAVAQAILLALGIDTEKIGVAPGKAPPPGNLAPAEPPAAKRP